VDARSAQLTAAVLTEAHGHVTHRTAAQANKPQMGQARTDGDLRAFANVG